MRPTWLRRFQVAFRPTLETSPAPRDQSAPLRIALATAAAYSLGAVVGFALRFPPATTSVLWPPNAILTAALLLVPPRRWWICLLAAFPVHLAIQLQAGFPLTLILGLFVTNCSEALLAATGIWLLSDAPHRLDTFRRVGIFVGSAVLAAPILSSFADAAVVHAVQGEAYWTVWRTRVFANTLAQIAVVPVVLGVVSGSQAHRLRGWAILEAAALAVGFALIGIAVFGRQLVPIDVPGLPRTPTPLMLPLLFWAALRFGPVGLGLGLLAFLVAASVATMAGERPFDRLPPTESLIALQITLVMMAIPLLCLTALVDEKRRAARDLASRLTFEELLARLSTAFVRLPSDQMAVAFQTCLSRIGHFLDVDRVVLMQLSPNGRHLLVLQQWVGLGFEPLPELHSCDDFPWVLKRLLSGDTVMCRTLDDLPPEAAADRQAADRLGLRSALVLPLVASGRVHGVMSLHVSRAPRDWSEEESAQARLVAEVMANALARKRIDDALRSSESMKTAILESLSSLVAVLDAQGIVIAVNQGWSGAPPLGGDHSMMVGADYLDVCRRAAAEASPGAAQALEGLERVLSGRERHFVYEYLCPTETGDRWFTMSVVPLLRPEGGVVVTHTDISDQKHAELEAQRARHELAHVTRISVMGELTSSLAHQLNQPLTGILSNAQAAQRYLDLAAPNMDEVRDIMLDIIDDDRRAGDVIRRLRDMVSRNDNHTAVVDLHALLRDVALLMNSDTIIRNVSVNFELVPGQARVSAHPVELQQVFVHLLVNAMEAVSDAPVHERTVVVRTERTQDLGVVVTVSDHGPGLPVSAPDELFEPFFTTKSTSLGMGLSIARSIVEAHGGRITAANNPGRGATFSVTLPLVPERVM